VRIEQLRKNYEIGIRWTAFPLHPETPEEGTTIEELYRARGIDVEAAKARLKKAADDLGLPMADRKMTYNSRLAQELAKWAETEGKGDSYHDAVFKAYYVSGRNIGKPGELVILAKSIGLPEEGAKTVLETRTFKEAVDADWARCHALGVTAVPTFVVNRRSVVGAQPYEVLEQLLKTSGARGR